MKKLTDAFLAIEKQKLDFQPAVVYLKGEPGVGKTQLARMYTNNYYNENRRRNVIVTTLDMTDFSSNYRKLATTLGIPRDLATGLHLRELAGEMKTILAEKSDWFLIIDNYNSTLQEGFQRGILK